MNNPIKKILFAIVAVIIVIASWVAWTVTRSSGPGEGFVSGNGRIEATEIDIATKYGGRLIDVFAQEGEFVQAGQVLVQMQIDVLNAQLDEAHAHRQQALNTVASAQAQVAMRASDLAVAQAVVVQRKSELNKAKQHLSHSQILVQEGAVSVQQFNDDQAAVRSAEAALMAAKAQVKAVQASIIAAKAQVTGARSAVATVTATITRIEVDVADSQLKARLIVDAVPNYVIPARVSFVSSVAQFTPKMVETASERQKLMFRVKARIDPQLLKKHIKQVKTGLPGVAWLKLDSQTEWPQTLQVKLPQ